MVGLTFLVFSFPVCQANKTSAFPDNPGFPKLCSSANSSSRCTPGHPDGTWHLGLWSKPKDGQNPSFLPSEPCQYNTQAIAVPCVWHLNTLGPQETLRHANWRAGKWLALTCSRSVWWKLLGFAAPVGWEIATTTTEACCPAKWWTKKLPANTTPFRTGVCILGRCSFSGILGGFSLSSALPAGNHLFPEVNKWWTFSPWKSDPWGAFETFASADTAKVVILARLQWTRTCSWNAASLQRARAETTWRALWPCHLSLLTAERSQSTNITTKLWQMVPGTSCIAANTSSLRSSVGITLTEWCSSVALNTWTVERSRKSMWEIHSERGKWEHKPWDQHQVGQTLLSITSQATSLKQTALIVDLCQHFWESLLGQSQFW